MILERESIINSPLDTKIINCTNISNNFQNFFLYLTENTIEIINKSDYSRKTINTDIFDSEITCLQLISPIELMVITKNRTKLIFKLELLKHVLIFNEKIDFIPESFVIYGQEMIYLYQHNLYSYPVQPNYQQQPKLLKQNIKENNIALSPYVNAILFFTIGSNTFKVHYLPMEKEDFIEVDVGSPIISIDFGYSNYVSIFTASIDGTVRFWIESQYAKEFTCAATFYTDSEITHIKSCIPQRIHPVYAHMGHISIPNSNIMPSYPIPEKYLYISLKDSKTNTIFLQIIDDYKIKVLVRINIPQNYLNSFACDLYNSCFNKKHSFNVYTTSLNNHGLFFGVFRFTDTVNFSPLYTQSFILGGIKRFVDHNYQVEQISGNILDLNTLQVFPPKDLNPKILIIAEKGFNFDFDVLIHDFLITKDQIMIVACGKEKSVVLFQKQKKTKIYELKNIKNEVTGISIHSTDLFTITTTDSIDVFFYEMNNQYIRIVQKRGKNLHAVFLPHLIPTLFICENKTATVHAVNHNSITEPLATFRVPLYNMLEVLKDGSVVGASNSSIDKLLIPKDVLPQIYDKDSDFIKQTEFCTGVIPNNPSEIITKTINILPNDYEILDICTNRFLFPYFFSKEAEIPSKTMELFSFWAYHCPNQEKLFEKLNLKNPQDLIESNIHLWAKDSATLISLISNFLTTNKLENESFLDLYAMICIACGKKGIAAKTFSKFGNDTLANFLMNSTLNEKDKALKINKNAYAALKVHRFFLAAMFFILNNEINDAINSLSIAKDWQFMLKRIFNLPLDNNSFFDYLLTKNHEKAKEALFNLEITRQNEFSLEYIRSEILIKMNHETRLHLLRLQKAPCLIEKIIESAPIISSLNYINNEIKEEIEEIQNKSDEISDNDFDFGSKFDIDDDIYSDYEEENNDEKEAPKYNIGYTVNNKILDFNPEEFVSNLTETLKEREFKEIAISTSDQKIASLLSAIFAQPSIANSKLLINIAHHVHPSVAFAIILCVCFVNGHYNILNMLEKDLSFDKVLTMKEDENILDYNTINFIGASIIDTICVKFAIFSFIQECIFKTISNEYSNIIAVIAKQHETMFFKSPIFELHSNKMLEYINDLNPSLIQYINDAEKTRLSIEYVTTMRYSVFSPFLSDSQFKTSEFFIDEEFPVTSIGYFGAYKPSIVYITNGNIKVAPVPINNVDLHDFDSPLLKLLPTISEVQYATIEEKTSLYEMRWGPEIPDLHFTCAAGLENTDFYAAGSEEGILSLGYEKYIVNALKVTNCAIKKIKFSRNKKSIACLDINGDLFLCKFSSNTPTLIAHCIDNFDWLNEDNQLACISSKRNTIGFYDYISGILPIMEYPLITETSNSCAFADCNFSIFYAANNGKIQLLNLMKGKYSVMDSIDARSVDIIETGPSYSYILTGCEDGSVFLRFGLKWNKLLFLQQDKNFSPLCLCTSKRVISAGHRKGVKFWIKDIL